MTIHVDTSALVDALAEPRRSLDTLIRLAGEGHRLRVSSLVLYEWLRGPRRAVELAAQEDVFPADAAVPFGAEQARIAAHLYRAVKNGRGREIDLAVAATALADGAALWTLNVDDFKDIPKLRLI
jgi:predicted nucleic acid-binding protein